MAKRGVSELPASALGKLLKHSERLKVDRLIQADYALGAELVFNPSSGDIV